MSKLADILAIIVVAVAAVAVLIWAAFVLFLVPIEGKLAVLLLVAFLASAARIQSRNFLQRGEK